MNRRQLIRNAGALAAGAGLSSFPLGWAEAADGKERRVLFFTKSSGFEHPVIKKPGQEPSFAGRVLHELGAKHNFTVNETKDGGIFTPEGIAEFDLFFFYTTGTLTEKGNDGNPPMSPAGKKLFLDAIHSGKGFVGAHSAADTFHTLPDPPDRANRYINHGEAADPYVRMIGAEFIRHGKQQESTMKLIDPRFPGCGELGGDFRMHEEWYSLKDFQEDLHVILVQETAGMEGPDYDRPPYPATWARKHGQGRVFYTSMGHREDVWTSSTFQSVLLGGMAWAAGNIKADVTPNIATAAPGYNTIPPRPA